VNFQGTPTGIADERDNARSINDTRFVVSNFRCAPCPADLTGDWVVNAADLAQLLGAWGLARLPEISPATTTRTLRILP
jgi:hypothetical protein